MRMTQLAVLALCICIPAIASGQTTPPATPPVPQPLTLTAAIDYARDHYPALTAAMEQVKASAAGVDVARAAFLPRLDAIWQSNFATANNVIGQVLPQSVIPALTGPVLPVTSNSGFWSSSTGALFSWEPVDFGARRGGVTNAEAALRRVRADESLTRLELQAAVASAFLTLVSAERAVQAAQADFDRRGVLRQNIQTLVANELRPGADAARADAERAASETRLIQTRQAVAVAKITLERLLGGVTVGSIDANRLVGSAPAAELPSPASVHPAVQVHDAAVEQARDLQTVLGATFRPRIFVEASLASRGSGAEPTGGYDAGLGGLKLDRVNWAAGFQVVFPNLFDLGALRAKQAAAAATTRAEVALDDEAKLNVASQQQLAAAFLESARAIAANTPVQLNAARQSEAQARARYAAGLATIAEVVDAQSVLAEAEMQDELARVDVWRALLASAVARGDLAPFVALLRQP